MRRTVLVTCFTTIAVIAACSSFDASDDPPAPVEAGADAPADVASTDADAGVAIDAAPPPFCKTDGGAFCEDFDDPGSAGLPGTSLWEGGTIATVVDPHFSEPKSLRVTFERPPDGTCRYATLYNPGLDVSIPNGYRVEYRIFAKTIPGRILHGVALGTRDTNTGQTCGMFMETTPSGAALVVDPPVSVDPGQSIQLSRKIVAGQWSHVVIDVSGGAGGRKVTVLIDGVVAVSGAMLVDACQAMDRVHSLDVGLLCLTVDVGGDVDVAFDDIRVIAY